jgi:SET domain-containing protein
MPTSARHLRIAPSGIHGLGAFFTAPLPTRSFIGFYSGRRYTPAQLARERWDDGLTYLFSLSNGETIDGAQGGNATRHINHSCAPNCEAVEERNAKGRLVLKIYTLAAVQEGDEAFIDYGLIVDESFQAADYPCYCAAPGCRGTLVA